MKLIDRTGLSSTEKSSTAFGVTYSNSYAPQVDLRSWLSLLQSEGLIDAHSAKNRSRQVRGKRMIEGTGERCTAGHSALRHSAVKADRNVCSLEEERSQIKSNNIKLNDRAWHGTA